MKTPSFDVAGATTLAASGPLDGLRRWLSYRDTVSEMLNLHPNQLAELGVRGDVEAHAWRLANR